MSLVSLGGMGGCRTAMKVLMLSFPLLPLGRICLNLFLADGALYRLWINRRTQWLYLRTDSSCRSVMGGTLTPGLTACIRAVSGDICSLDFGWLLIQASSGPFISVSWMSESTWKCVDTTDMGSAQWIHVGDESQSHISKSMTMLGGAQTCLVSHLNSGCPYIAFCSNRPSYCSKVGMKAKAIS